MISGPVSIPKLYNGKNKTFFQVAGSYHVDSSSNAGTDTTPTAAELAGNFSAYYQRRSTTRRPPRALSPPPTFPATPFPGNVIPPIAFQHACGTRSSANNPFAPPQAGVGSITNTGPSGNIVTSGTGNYFNLTNQFRVDHNFSNRLKAEPQLFQR